MTGKQLRRRRIAKGLRANFIADKLGIDPARLCEMEKGIRSLTPQQIALYRFHLK